MITAKQLEAHKKWLAGDVDGQRIVLQGASLRGASLRGADLQDADLRGAFLRGASLQGAYLRGADLQDADLQDAFLQDADLQDAVLQGAFLQGAVLQGAVLQGADLQGAFLQGADLRDAVLRDAIGLPIAADAQERLRAVATAALQPNALAMETWHTCETTHCMAGWAIHLAGEPGEIMEKMLGPELTGLLLLGAEAHQYFYKSNDEAREFLSSVLSGEDK